MVRFAAGADEWAVVRQQLAVFVTSSVRGKQAPYLAWMLLGRRSMPATLDRRLTELHDALLADGTADAVQHAAGAHTALGLPRGERHWQNAAHLLQPLVARHLRRHSDPAEALEHLDAAIAEHRTGLLTHAVGEPVAPVQLMGLYQTKGREADATVVVLRSSDFYGPEWYEPFETGSRLLYVVLSRARHKTVVLLFGDDPQPLVAPLVKLAS
jgi:DNA helicase II / ATP-dependent DNA helicase PcrA